jgi:serine/threonine protein kinase
MQNQFPSSHIQPVDASTVPNEPLYTPNDRKPSQNGLLASKWATDMGSNEVDDVSNRNSNSQHGESYIESERSSDEGSIADAESQRPDYLPIYDCNDIENIYDYIPGGHHPTHIGDLLAGRFEVIHKLGCGGYAIVWLCFEVEEEQWRAVKIIKASKSTPDSPELKVKTELLKHDGADLNQWKRSHLILPLEHFWLDGPNGRHLCEVMPVLGPKISHDPLEALAVHSDPARPWRICRQIGEALRFLHERGICHGDLTDNNILLQLKDISHFGKTEMLDLLGEPTVKLMRSSTGEDLGPSAPKYAVLPTDLKPLGFTDDVGIIDFGEAFKERQPPETMGIPGAWGAPEAVFTSEPDCSVDVWSLACLILKMRANKNLFGNDQRSYTRCIENLLGPLPLRHREACMRLLEKAVAEKRLSELPDLYDQMKNPDPHSFVGPPGASSILRAHIERLKEETGHEEWIHSEIAQEQELLIYSEDDDYGEDYDPEYVEPEIVLFKLPDTEVRVLGDLLTSIFKYDPSERPDIKAVLDHEWFKVGPLGLGAITQRGLETKRREERVGSVTTSEVPAKLGEHHHTAHGTLDSDEEKEAIPGHKPPPGEKSTTIENDVSGTIQSTVHFPPTQPTTAVPTETQQSLARRLSQCLKTQLSDAFKTLKNPRNRETFDLIDLIVVLVLGTAIVLGFLLYFVNRHHRVAPNVGGQAPSCEHSVLFVTSAVRSSTSTYIQGLVGFVEHWTGKLDGVVQCECRVKG